MCHAYSSMLLPVVDGHVVQPVSWCQSNNFIYAHASSRFSKRSAIIETKSAQCGSRCESDGRWAGRILY